MNNQYFENQMKQLLADDYQLFSDAFEQPMKKSLRINRLKTTVQEVEQEIAIGESTPFDPDSFYLQNDEKLGKHPYHLAGLYYLQEPSAAMAVNALDVQPGDFVIDFCASPGGKSTQILSRLNNSGFLVSNEYERGRTSALLSNIERWGADNYLICNNTVDQVSRQFEAMADRILVDAPCSGASMFKKYPQTVDEYNENAVMACQRRQLQILDDAVRALKKDGVLVYSTCTYNLQENEEVVAGFLADHPDFVLDDCRLECGQPGFDSQHLTRRVFPYQGGEGHFCARMIRRSENRTVKLRTLPYSHNSLVDEFIKDNLVEKPDYTIIGDNIYLSGGNLADVHLNIIRQGILLGQIVKGRIEPHHHLYLSNYHFKRTFEIENAQQLQAFLSGNSIMAGGYRGFVQICYHGHGIGFGKGDGQQIKNRFPKGLRSV